MKFESKKLKKMPWWRFRARRAMKQWKYYKSDYIIHWDAR